MATKTTDDIGPIRHKIDIKGLEKYISNNVKEIEIPIEVSQFGYGQSNPSYLIKSCNNKQFVLRRKPPGKLISKTAHAIDREYYMINALKKYDKNFPVPNVFCLCNDSKIIGSEFYIMEFINGRIFHSPSFPSIKTKKEKEIFFHSAVETLAKLHSINPTELVNYLPKNFNIKIPLNVNKNINSSKGYYSRQVKTLEKVSSAQALVQGKNSKTGDIPYFKEICKWLVENIPSNDSSMHRIVHGDFKIDNLVFHSVEPKVIAILDWELCTIGNPLSDLANLLQPFSVISTAPRMFKELNTSLNLNSNLNSYLMGISEDDLKNLPSSYQIRKWYTSFSDWDPEPIWKFGVVFSHFRLAVITQGIQARFISGNASSSKAEEYGSKFPFYGNLAYYTIHSNNKAKL